MNRILRIFVSSPGDVGEERLLTHRVIKRLQGELSEKITLEGIFWEQEPLLATDDFQTQLPGASKADIAVFVLWSRLGTPLSGDRFVRSDGSTYSSGTEYEFEEVVRSFRHTGFPNIIVYRKTTDPVTPLRNKEEVLARLAQKDALNAFIEKWFVGSDGSFTAAFHPYTSTAQFESYIEEHLRKLIVQSLTEDEKEFSERPSSAWEGSPFRGLEVFDVEHAPIFFGRTQAIGDILNALRHQATAGSPFVLVTGMSGVGKSSVVRAGVLPSLIQPGIIEGVGLWSYAIMRPAESAGDLFDGLAAALFRDNALEQLSPALKPTELAALLKQSPESVIPIIKMALSQAAAELQERRQLKAVPSARLVLFVDQLEEIFTMQRISLDERRMFIEALATILKSGLIWIISSMRSDFYHRCSEITALQDLKEGNGTYDLKPPSAAEILQMIRQPARIAGLRFEEDSGTGARLDDVLYNAVVNRIGALPLLEFTLQELFSICGTQGILTFPAYHSLGGIEGALAKRAEAVFSALSSEVQAQLPAVLSAMVGFGHIDRRTPVRRHVPLDSFKTTPGILVLIDAFVQARLFVTDRSDDGTAVISMAHEALLQHWPRLREWIEKNIDLLIQRTRLTERAKRWQDAGNLSELMLESGKVLDDAEALVEQATATLTDTEKTFVLKSTKKRRSKGKYAWLGGTICWAVILGLLFKNSVPHNTGETLSTIPLLNFALIMILFTILFLPVAWTTFVRWRAAPLTKELGAGKIFWTIILIFYLFFCLSVTAYLVPGTGIETYVLLFLILGVIAYNSGEKWLQSHRRKRQINAIRSVTGRASSFRFPYRDLAILIAFVLLGAAFFFSETDTSPTYKENLFRSFSRNSGVPHGVGPLDPGKPDLPYIHFKFSHDGKGRAIRVEQIGLPGMCAMPSPTNYQNLAQSIGFNEQACIFEYQYDADGTLRTETAHNKMGQKVWTLKYSLPDQAYLLLSDLKTVLIEFKRSAEGTEEEIWQLNTDRIFGGSDVEAVALRHRMTYDALGVVTSIQTTDLAGRPALSAGRSHATTEFSHNSLGLLTEIRYYSEKNDLVINEKGFAIETITYNTKGNMTGYAFLDTHHHPVKCSDGYAKATLAYGEHGKLTEIALKDEAGQAIALPSGINRQTFDYDDEGNLLGQALWGLDGQPAQMRVVITSVCCEAEKLGLWEGDVIESYDGQLVLNQYSLDHRMRRGGLTKRDLTVERDGKQITFRVSPGVIGAYFAGTLAKSDQ